jgi:hypothetical protein
MLIRGEKLNIYVTWRGERKNRHFLCKCNALTLFALCAAKAWSAFAHVARRILLLPLLLLLLRYYCGLLIERSHRDGSAHAAAAAEVACFGPSRCRAGGILDDAGRAIAARRCGAWIFDDFAAHSRQAFRAATVELLAAQVMTSSSVHARRMGAAII